MPYYKCETHGTRLEIDGTHRHLWTSALTSAGGCSLFKGYTVPQLDAIVESGHSTDIQLQRLGDQPESIAATEIIKRVN